MERTRLVLTFSHFSMNFPFLHRIIAAPVAEKEVAQSVPLLHDTALKSPLNCNYSVFYATAPQFALMGNATAFCGSEFLRCILLNILGRVLTSKE